MCHVSYLIPHTSYLTCHTIFLIYWLHMYILPFNILCYIHYTLSMVAYIASSLESVIWEITLIYIGTSSKQPFLTLTTIQDTWFYTPAVHPQVVLQHLYPPKYHTSFFNSPHTHIPIQDHTSYGRPHTSWHNQKKTDSLFFKKKSHMITSLTTTP